jgi:hypothetical protein
MLMALYKTARRNLTLDILTMNPEGPVILDINAVLKPPIYVNEVDLAKTIDMSVGRNNIFEESYCVLSKKRLYFLARYFTVQDTPANQVHNLANDFMRIQRLYYNSLTKAVIDDDIIIPKYVKQDCSRFINEESPIHWPDVKTEVQDILLEILRSQNRNIRILLKASVLKDGKIKEAELFSASIGYFSRSIIEIQGRLVEKDIGKSNHLNPRNIAYALAYAAQYGRTAMLTGDIYMREVIKNCVDKHKLPFELGIEPHLEKPFTIEFFLRKKYIGDKSKVTRPLIIFEYDGHSNNMRYIE